MIAKSVKLQSIFALGFLTALAMASPAKAVDSPSGRIKNEGNVCACISTKTTGVHTGVEGDGKWQCADPGKTSNWSSPKGKACWAKYKFIYYLGAPTCASKDNRDSQRIPQEKHLTYTRPMKNGENIYTTVTCTSDTIKVYPGRWYKNPPLDPNDPQLKY